MARVTENDLLLAPGLTDISAGPLRNTADLLGEIIRTSRDNNRFRVNNIGLNVLHRTREITADDFTPFEDLTTEEWIHKEIRTIEKIETTLDGFIAQKMALYEKKYPDDPISVRTMSADDFVLARWAKYREMVINRKLRLEYIEKQMKERNAAAAAATAHAATPAGQAAAAASKAEIAKQDALTEDYRKLPPYVLRDIARTKDEYFLAYYINDAGAHGVFLAPIDSTIIEEGTGASMRRYYVLPAVVISTPSQSVEFIPAGRRLRIDKEATETTDYIAYGMKPIVKKVITARAAIYAELKRLGYKEHPEGFVSPNGLLIRKYHPDYLKAKTNEDAIRGLIEEELKELGKTMLIPGGGKRYRRSKSTKSRKSMKHSSKRTHKKHTTRRRHRKHRTTHRK